MESLALNCGLGVLVVVGMLEGSCNEACERSQMVPAAALSYLAAGSSQVYGLPAFEIGNKDDGCGLNWLLDADL